MVEGNLAGDVLGFESLVARGVDGGHTVNSGVQLGHGAATKGDHCKHGMKSASGKTLSDKVCV